MADYRAGAYLRLSRDDERDGESMSIENQRAFLHGYIREQGWELTDTYIDDGFTGLNFDRPGFQRMIGDVKSGRINLVIVKDLSRFGRNYIQMGEYTDYLFPSAHCRFIAVNDGVDTKNDNNDIMPFKNLFNEYYSRDISKKVKTGKMVRAKNGHCMAVYAPYGYIATKDLPLPRDEAKPYIIDETAAPIVRRIFQMRCEGTGYRSIATKLNADGVPTPRDHWYELRQTDNPRNVTHKWSDNTVKQILTNEAYIGNLVQMKSSLVSYKNKKRTAKAKEDWIRVEGTHDPIVTRLQWDKVQRMAEHCRVYRPTKDGELSLFAGLLECADCHKSMKFVRDSNRSHRDGHKWDHHAYVCGTYGHAGVGTCTPHRTLQSVLENLVMADLGEKAERIQLDEDKVVADLQRKKNSEIDAERILKEKELKKLQSRLGDLDRLIQKLYEEMTLGDLPREAMLSMMDKYRKEQETKRNRISSLTEELTHSHEVDTDIREWVSLMKRYMGVETLDRELLTALIDKIIVGQKTTEDGISHQEITIIYNFVGQVE